MDMSMGMGMGGKLALTEGVGWWNADALVDLDLLGSRTFFNGQAVALADFLASNGGVQAGNTITIAPKVVGDELIADPGFDSGITGWANGSSYESVGTLAWDGTGKRLTCTVPSRDGVTPVQMRYAIAVSVPISKAYVFGARNKGGRDYLSGSWNVKFDPSNAFGGKAIPPANVTLADGARADGYAGANATTMYLGMTVNSSNTTPDGWDDVTVKEVVPLVGHNYLATSLVIEGVTPATASGNKVVFQGDTDDERFRLRVVWGADKHMRVIATAQNTEQANLDLGVVEVSTGFTVRASATANSFKASLDGGVIVSDTAGQHPAMAFYRIGRSYTGETWDGTISRVTIFPTAMSDADMTDPLRAFMVFGDSTANGDGAGVTVKWYDALRAAYTPDRSVAEAAQGGENTTQMLARVAADTDHRRWTTIFMDRPNTGESSATWLANMKAAVAYLETGRWLIVPPVLNSPSGQPDGSATAIGGVQAALLADPFFAGHTLDAAEQAAYIAEMNDDATRVSGDWVHFNDAGQALQAARIKTFLDTAGW